MGVDSSRGSGESLEKSIIRKQQRQAKLQQQRWIQLQLAQSNKRLSLGSASRKLKKPTQWLSSKDRSELNSCEQVEASDKLPLDQRMIMSNDNLK